MNILKTLICAALLVAGLSGCEKINVNKLEGTLAEQYDPTVFAMDGSVTFTFTFDGNNGYQLHVYDALSGESHDYSGHYAIDLIDKGTITINPAMSDFSNVTYKLVKLTSKEMEWQKEGLILSEQAPEARRRAGGKGTGTHFSCGPPCLPGLRPNENALRKRERAYGAVCA